MRDFENRPAEEFRLSVAYQKFEERVVQMRQVGATECSEYVQRMCAANVCSECSECAV
jgi:hypothetical protein